MPKRNPLPILRPDLPPHDEALIMTTYPNIVAGQPVLSATTFESRNPATGELLGLVPHSSPEQVAQAVAAAQAAQPAWAALPDAERQAALTRVADILHAQQEHLAGWITREQGKPLGGVGPDQVPGARPMPARSGPACPPAWHCRSKSPLKTTPAATRCTVSPTAWWPPSRPGTGH